MEPLKSPEIGAMATSGHSFKGIDPKNHISCHTTRAHQEVQIWDRGAGPNCTVQILDSPCTGKLKAKCQTNS